MKTNIFVVTGGPCVGKTTIVNELGKIGYNIIPEAARIASGTGEFAGKNVHEVNPLSFQNQILKTQIKLHEDFLLRNNGIAFSDRGFGDSLAYYKLRNLKFPKEYFDYVRKFRYLGIFLLEPLRFYKTDKLRTETREEQIEIHNEIGRAYENLGYDLIRVPLISVRKRVEFIIGTLGP